MVFLIAPADCKYRNTELLSQSVLPVASIAMPTPQAKSLQAMYRPKEGYVPDAATAIKIAEAVLTPIYGEETLKNERPFRANLVDGEWQVNGTLPENTDGGTAFVAISKEDGCILTILHTK